MFFMQAAAEMARQGRLVVRVAVELVVLRQLRVERISVAAAAQTGMRQGKLVVQVSLWLGSRRNATDSFPEWTTEKRLNFAVGNPKSESDDTR